MKKWWMWFILSGMWILTTILNVIDKRSSATISVNAFVVIFFATLGIIQHTCDKKGEKGKKIFNRICIFSTIMLVLLLILIIASALN